MSGKRYTDGEVLHAQAFNKLLDTVDALVAGGGVKFEIVESLPASGDAATIYLVPSESSGVSNFYDEYIWVDNAWECVGSTNVNLDEYYTKTQTDNLLSGYATTSALTTGLATKQNTISDLQTIREGAALGATALQSFTETDPTVPAWAKRSSKPTYTVNEITGLSSALNEKQDKVPPEPLRFTVLADTTIGITHTGSNKPNIQISTDDGTTWTTWNYNTITIAAGETLMIRGMNVSGFNISASKYSTFTMTPVDSTVPNAVAITGNIMSLIDYTQKIDIIPNNTCFYSLFKDCSILIASPELPATALKNNCYREMFYNCTSLTTAPALPATVLADYCYYGMFQGCSSLTMAPMLPAVTLAIWCYNSMFRGCTSLETAPSLPAATLAESCYRSMFRDCTSLTDAPDLLTPVLVDSCYRYMFYGCSSLEYVRCLATSGINQDNSTGSWLSNVASTGTFVKDCNTDWGIAGTSTIPSGWTIVNHYDDVTLENKLKPKGYVFNETTKSFAEGDGNYNIAVGEYSHAEGYGTTASGDYSHAEGGLFLNNMQLNGGVAMGNGSHAEGVSMRINNVAIQYNSETDKYIFSSSVPLRFVMVGMHIWVDTDIPQKDGVRYRIRSVDDTEPGYWKVELDNGPEDNFTGMFVVGYARGVVSHAEGASLTLGEGSHAEGGNTVAEGDYSHAEGKSTIASGYASHAEGKSTIASGYASHAEGDSTIASGERSHAEGKSTIASKYYSHAEGYNTTAEGGDSHAEGLGTTASGYASHAEGDSTTASGAYTHSEGYNTTASGDYTHSEGYNTTASGNYSHAEGYNTTAEGGDSHAEGLGTTTSNESEHAEGRYNISNHASNTYGNAGNTQHSIGIGTNGNNRKNAVEVMQNGDVYVIGIGGYDGTNAGSAQTLQQVLSSINNQLNS